MIVLSVDPGGTSKVVRGSTPAGPGGATGAVLFRPVSKLEIEVLCWKEIVERWELLDWVRDLKLYSAVDYVICEAYKPAAFVKTYQPDVIYIIGTLDYMFQDKFFNRTFAATANAWGTDTKMNPYRRGENPVGRGGHGHALMALRHALHWTAHYWDGKS